MKYLSRAAYILKRLTFMKFNTTYEAYHLNFKMEEQTNNESFGGRGMFPIAKERPKAIRILVTIVGTNDVVVALYQDTFVQQRSR